MKNCFLNKDDDYYYYYDKPYTDKTLQWQPLFSNEQKEDINSREKENYLSVDVIFFWNCSLPTWVLTSQMSDVSKSNVEFQQVGFQHVGF